MTAEAQGSSAPGSPEPGRGGLELRRPPLAGTAAPASRDRAVRWLLGLNAALILALGAVVLLRPGGGTGAAEERAERRREVAAKLKAAGALGEAAALWEDYLAAAEAPAETRARIAYSLGTTYLDRGRYEKALRWFYEAEALGGGGLGEELGQKVVHALERLGRHHAAQAALGGRVRLGGTAPERAEDDPVVARIGEREIARSEVVRFLDDLPPGMAPDLQDREQRREALRRFVADELLWRKVQKLEYDDDPEVRRRHAALLRQLAVAAFLDREVAAKITADEADLRNYYAAHPERYREPEADEPRPFDAVRPLVERDYRLEKAQAAYATLIDSELATAEVELYPERMDDGG